MREILFRGKSVNDGRWVFGDLSNYGDCKTITTVKDLTIIDSCEVIPETVGQYTGLSDKNGERIFEEDVVSTESRYSKLRIWIVKWENEKYYLSGRDYDYDLSDVFVDDDNLTVIGNIWDNPELLEDGNS